MIAHSGQGAAAPYRQHQGLCQPTLWLYRHHYQFYQAYRLAAAAAQAQAEQSHLHLLPTYSSASAAASRLAFFYMCVADKPL
jgi:hypothetical protein